MAHEETILNELQIEIKAFAERHKTALHDVTKRMDLIEVRMANPGVGADYGTYSGKSLADEIFESAEFKAFASTGRGRCALKIADFDKKTTISATGLGHATSGVVPIYREPGIQPVAMRTFRMRDLLRAVPVSGAGAIDFVRVTAAAVASPQTEASDKHETALPMSSASEKIRTIATWIPATRQVMQDLNGLQEAVNVHLLSALYDQEDQQILNGDGTGENFHGLCHQATAFDTSLPSLPAGWGRADLLGYAFSQAAAANCAVTGVVLHPTDFWRIILTKSTTGEYIFGNPATMAEARVFGVPCAITTAQAAGSFLVGDFATGAALYRAMDAIVEVSSEHSDYWVKNMLAIRAELREALVVYNTAKMIFGSFTTSPA